VSRTVKTPARLLRATKACAVRRAQAMEAVVDFEIENFVKAIMKDAAHLQKHGYVRRTKKLASGATITFTYRQRGFRFSQGK